MIISFLLICIISWLCTVTGYHVLKDLKKRLENIYFFLLILMTLVFFFYSNTVQNSSSPDMVEPFLLKNCQAIHDSIQSSDQTHFYK